MKRFLLLILLFCLRKIALAQVPEAEPNNSFATANPVARYELKTATVNASNDVNDYFRAVLPEDGTLKIYVQAICTGTSSTGWLYFYGYDRRKTGSFFDKYITNNTAIPVGVTVFDTITLNGMAADTFYFRFTTNRTFNYQFSYSITDITTNDAEPNNTFATALPIALNEVKQGHQHYYANGDTYDDNDYYRAVLGADGTVKIYVDAINQGRSNGWMYMYVYDRRKTADIFGKYLGNSTAITRGTQFKDTITLYGMAADTVYFRLQTSGQAFSYNIKYNQTDLTPNDVEPNNTFATALPIAINEVKQGHQHYYANGDTYDNTDYYRAILPADGTLKLYVNATNQGSSNGWIHLYVYDRRKTSDIFSKFLANSTSILRGNSIRDTITIYGMAADTVYFRLSTSGQAFSYDIKYNQTDITPNDVEPNNTFATALPLALGETKQGHIRYFAAGSTDDDFDFYRITPSVDGTQKIYVEATNQSGSNGWIYMNVYDRRKTADIFGKYIDGSTAVPRGTTIRDTIILYGQAADTSYIRFYTNDRGFSYKLRYEVVDTSINDAEPNNTFSTALNLSGGAPALGHINYAYNGTTDVADYYKTEFASNDSLKLYIQATNMAGEVGHFYLYGYNEAQSGIYDRQRYSVPAGATIFDSIKIAVTAPQTIYNRVWGNGRAFTYQLTLNSRLPGNGFSILGRSTACTNAAVYKAINVAPSDAGVVYHWSVSGGGTITFTDSIATVAWTTPGTHTISLYISNENGASVTKKMNVVVNSGTPPAAPTITVKGRYLDIAALPAGAIRQWYKDGVALTGITDSVYYAATAGSYTATYVNDCGESVPSAAVVMNTPQAQTISFPTVADIVYSPDSLRKLIATASSGLPITYKIISGPGTISNDTLRPTGYGSIVVQALQYGSATYEQAAPVSITVNVVKGSQAIVFDSIPAKIYTANASFALSATSSSGLSVSFQVVSGPATISGSLLKMTGVGTVVVKAVQTGNANYDAASEITRSFCIGVREIQPIAGPAVSCINTLRYTTKKIPGALYQWSLDGGGILTTSGDTAIVQWQTGGNHTLTVRGYSACDTVRSAAQTLSVFVDPDYTVAPVTGLLPASGSTNLSLPLTLQWNSIAKATTYDLYVWPVGFDQPVLPLDSNLVQVNYTLQENISLNQPYNWKVVAKNSCTSAQSAVQQFTVAEINNTLPDLVLDTFYFSQPLYQGQPVTITWRVKNIGTKGTGADAWKDRIYISPSASIRVSESTLLGTFNNPSYLLPGETYTQTKTVTIPAGYGGTWWLSVITDNVEAFCFSEACNVEWGPGHYNHNGQSVQERNEANNYRRTTVSVLDGPLPDLQVQSIGVPGALFGGTRFNLTYRVKNIGVAPAAGKVLPGCPQRAWRDRFFITSEPTFNIATARELGSGEVRFIRPGVPSCGNDFLPYIDYLLPDSSYTIQQPLAIPYDHYGKQYFWVFVNGYNDAYEGPFNTNNLLRSDSINVTLAAPADLVVTSIQNIPTYNAGENVVIQYTVTNQGANEPLEEVWNDSVWICSSPTFSPANIIAKGRVGRNRPLPFGTNNTYTVNTHLRLPNGTSGTYYVFVKTDAAGEVFEYNQEGNNQLRSNAFTVNVGPLYDLLITAIAAPDTVTAGVPFNLSMTVKNAGSSPLASSRWDHLYARTNNTLDVSGNAYILRFLPGGNDTLQPGAQRTYTGQATIGTYSETVGRSAYIQAMVDATDGIYEHNAEGNNVFIRATPVFVKAPPAPPVVDRRSNPGIQSFTAPASVVAGNNISFSWTVKNSGPLATTKTYWQDRVYLSADTTISNGDYELKRASISQYTQTGLLPDSIYTQTYTAQIPLTVYGNYYLILRSDATNDIANDSTDADNFYRIPINISVPPVPDLVITALNNLPDSVYGNSAFYLKYKVQNAGTATANPNWYDRVYVVAGNIPVGYGLRSNHHETALAPGASYIDSILVEVPVYYNGAYSAILHTDGRDDIYEGPSGNGNNLSVRPVTVYPYNSRPAPDLIVQSLAVPDSVIMGKDLTASFTIKNNSTTVPAVGNLTNALYLSSNAVFESDLDKLLMNTELPNILLQPGQSFQTQLTGKALPSTGGRYRSIIRTNSRNTVYEGPFTTNNIKASGTTTYIEALTIPLNTNIADTLIPNYGNYYKVTVGAGLDLSVTLNTPYGGNGSLALYIGYNRVPDPTNFDVTGVNPAALNQQALLSNTQAGTYYIRAESFGIPVNIPAMLRVEAIPFSIVSASPTAMGQGTVTGAIRGGGFKPNTQILLRKNGSSYNVGTIRQFINSTSLAMQWNLDNVPTGVYDVVAINPGIGETVLTNGVSVEIKREYQLEYTPLLPAQVRPFGGVFTYKGKNTGNVNIPVIQGDITMVAKNATIHSVSTTGRIRRYTKYIPQADSLMEQDWYLTGKNRAIPFIGRNLAPGEEFTITVDLRFKGGNVASEQKNVFPLQCRMWGYTGREFAREQVRVFEMVRLLLMNDPRSARIPNDVVVRGAYTGSKFFAEKMMNEYVTAGLMDWSDTIGTAFRWDCSRCLQLLSEVRPVNSGIDTFTYSPASEMVVGTKTLGTGQVFREKESLLVEMNKGLYWDYYSGAKGQPGAARGWDLIKVDGTLFVSATAARPFKIYLSSLAYSAEAGRNRIQQLGGWNPAYDTSYLIVVASGGINGYDASKFAIDLTYFSNLNPLRLGHFTTELHRGYGLGGDSIMLKWVAYKPGWGERGVDGVDGAVGEPGSPGGRGGTGNAQNPKGGRGGNGGRGGDEYGYPPYIFPAGKGGRGGPGGYGYGSGGDGGDAGESGSGNYLRGADGEKGGEGEDAGPNGGNGGTGGKGGKAGASSNVEGAVGGNGGDGGDGTNSGRGGNGGDGGDGGKGGSSCGSGLQGGGGGNGGESGSGPIGNGNYGASGKKGIFGPPLDCPPCSEPLQPSTDAAKEAASLIDYGKAAYGAIEGDYLGAGLGTALEVLNQNSSEASPSVNLAVQGVDLYLAARLAGQTATAEWTLMCKGTVVLLKGGDYVVREVFYNGKDYPLSTEVKFLTEFFSTISSVPDMVAFGLKQLSSFGAGLSFSFMVKPCDPNEVVGPAGHGDPKFVNRSLSMPYTIHFENDSALAEVAAQRVVVRQPISSKADPLTFKLGGFGFAGHTFEVPENLSNYFTVLNFDSLGYSVEVTAGVDIVKREAFWIFQTIDPQTGLPPSNIFLGLLPVNDSLERGHGFVKYSIKPLVSDITGDSITAKASIVFDENEPVETNTWVNVVDAFAPTSSLSGLPATSNNPVINLRYTGVDDQGGSGLKYVNIYVSDNGAAPVLYVANWTGTDTLFYGEQNHTYTFYGQATDNVLNKEALKDMGSVTITENSCFGNAFAFSSNVNGASYQWQVNTGSGWSNITDGDTYSGTIGKVLSLINATGPMYGYQYRSLVNGSTYSNVFTLRYVTFWEGAKSTAWEEPGNWSCGAVPNQYTDVVIPGNKERFPQVNSNVIIRTLRANTVATVTVKTGANITVLR